MQLTRTFTNTLGLEYAELAINNFSSLISANKLRNILINIVKKKISPNTVNDLLNHLEDANLTFTIPLFSYKIKEQKLYPKKIYCIDNGIINAVSIRFREKLGGLYENIVAIELKRRGKEIYYWKNTKHEELDFLIKENLKVKKAINVCYDLQDKETKNRELKGLLSAAKEFKLKEGTIITKDYSGEEIIENIKIKYIPLWKWLLQKL